MSVYVDTAKYKFGRMIMCHMVADTLEELHAMADKIGVARRHYQTAGGRSPHYDICKAKRALAVQYGAIELTRARDIMKPIMKLRAEGLAKP
jgi:hypothetical protein